MAADCGNDQPAAAARFAAAAMATEPADTGPLADPPADHIRAQGIDHAGDLMAGHARIGDAREVNLKEECPMAQLRPLDPAFPIDRQLAVAASPVVLINVLAVDANEVDTLLEAWAKDVNWIKKQPGFISTQLHRAIGDSHLFLNYAVWELVDHFRQSNVAKGGGRCRGPPAPIRCAVPPASRRSAFCAQCMFGIQ